MRTNARIFFFLSFFFTVADLVYYFTSHDPTGTTALAFAIGLAFLIGYYLEFTARRLPPQPEDETEAEIADGAGELGFFSPHSPWPIGVAFGAAITFLGLVYGWWLLVIGAGITGAASMGLLFEYYVSSGSGAGTGSHFHS